ncbi:MAG TPA: ABC transporter substrate-binding protein [Devosia sp.]|nr:ABC transporter substrate-binding protein [Devosia sp.]
MKAVIFALAAFAVSLGAAPAFAQNFPVTVTHEFGETTIPAKPQRVVSIGMHEQDFLYALGVAPVGVHEWWGDYPYATWPWAEEARKAANATPEVLKAWEINIEWVAAQRPDLIVATYFGDLDEGTYQLLSAIAPTITAPKGYPAWGAPWQDELRLLGRATGTSDRAEAIVADIDGRFSAARAAHPEFGGKFAATGYVEEGMVRTYNSADTAHRFLTSLGLAIPAQYDELSVDRGHLDVSTENLSLIDIDAFIWPDGTAGIDELSLYKATRLAREGRSISLGGGVLAAAMSFQTPLALGYLIEVLPPMLEAALDGDPATPVPVPAE